VDATALLRSDQGGIVESDAPPGMIQANAMPSHRARSITHFQQEKFVVCSAPSERRCSTTKGGSNNLKANDVGVEVHHGLHRSYIENIMSEFYQKYTSLAANLI
jgi:hypothetical protein